MPQYGKLPQRVLLQSISQSSMQMCCCFCFVALKHWLWPTTRRAHQTPKSSWERGVREDWFPGTGWGRGRGSRSVFKQINICQKRQQKMELKTFDYVENVEAWAKPHETKHLRRAATVAADQLASRLRVCPTVCPVPVPMHVPLLGELTASMTVSATITAFMLAGYMNSWIREMKIVPLMRNKRIRALILVDVKISDNCF